MNGRDERGVSMSKMSTGLGQEERGNGTDSAGGGLGLVWGAKAIGAEINRSPRQAFHLLETGAIRCARKVNNLWCAPRSGLRAEFCG
jgi:hypothetical protein